MTAAVAQDPKPAGRKLTAIASTGTLHPSASKTDLRQGLTPSRPVSAVGQRTEAASDNEAAHEKVCSINLLF